MTLHHLDVQPDDVAASELGYRVDFEPAPAALATAVLEHPHHPVSLRVAILGASHAVTVIVDGRDSITEEVSCRASTAGGGLPLTGKTHACPEGVHHLRGAVDAVPSGRFSAVVRELTDRAVNEPHVLAGRFPGAEGALTVVEARAHSRGWQWRTWHLYPADETVEAGGEIVTTESGFEMAFAGAVTEEVA
ncbi:MAG TPA: DUF2617 family protein [Candidatus Dietzia merdigallinarum]|nr:DUF2617 family protein [Candidatus Dietzia merdigallinarum]